MKTLHVDVNKDMSWMLVDIKTPSGLFAAPVTLWMLVDSNRSIFSSCDPVNANEQ